MLECLANTINPSEIQEQIIQYLSYPELLRLITAIRANKLYDQEPDGERFTNTESYLLTHFTEKILKETDCTLELYNGETCCYSCVLTPVIFYACALVIEFQFNNASQWIDKSPISEFLLSRCSREKKSQHQLKKENSERKWHNQEIENGKLFPDELFEQVANDEEDEANGKKSFEIQLSFKIPRPDLTGSEEQSILLPNVVWNENDFDAGCDYTALPDLHLSCGAGCAPESLKLRITPTFLIRLWNDAVGRKQRDLIQCDPISVSSVGIQKMLAASKLLPKTEVRLSTNDIRLWALKCPNTAAEIALKTGGTAKAESAINEMLSQKVNCFKYLTKRYQDKAITRDEMILDFSSLLTFASLHNETFQDFHISNTNSFNINQ